VERASAERRMVLNDDMLAEVAAVQNRALDVHSSWIASCRAVDGRPTMETAMARTAPLDRATMHMADTLSRAAAQYNRSLDHQQLLDVGRLPVQPLGACSLNLHKFT